jgi:pimeloyl-ACP methyl ester carboxylesterase
MKVRRMAAIPRPSASGVFLLLGLSIGSAATRAETPAGPAPVSVEAPNGASAAVVAPDATTGSYRVRKWIRNRVVSEDDLQRYRLCLDEEWQRAPADKPVAVMIHGFNSTPVRNAGLLAPIRAADYPCGTFAYANDYHLSAAAELLSTNLRQFQREYPNRRVALVCHSTGGLVARACIEDESLDPGNVDRLIMIAPPTHGSLLARCAVGTDIWEHWLSRREGSAWARFHDSIVDGLGEAADDLCPGSVFLRELNARPRNPRVRYSIILGTSAMVEEEQLNWIRTRFCEKLKGVPGLDEKVEEFDALFADYDELVQGKGDGVVAVKRGRLEGVDDVVLMPFCHMHVGGPSDNRELAALYRAVVDRLVPPPLGM